MPYELWDIETRNMIGNYATEAEALERVRLDFECLGRDFVSTYVLDGPNHIGWKHQIAEGEDLIRLAQHHAYA